MGFVVAICGRGLESVGLFTSRIRICYCEKYNWTDRVGRWSVAYVWIGCSWTCWGIVGVLMWDALQPTVRWSRRVF